MAATGRVIALIPARGGSKGVPGKNTVELGGHPLIAYSIAAGAMATTVDRVIVTTDAPEIAELAVRLGAEAPFLRPAELAADDSPDIDYVRHAIDWLERNEGSGPELIVQLRPTTPLREPARVDEAVRAIDSRAEATGLRSVHQLPEPPQKMLGISEGWLTGLFPEDERPEYYNLPRQSFPPAYWPNGYVDVIRRRTVKEEGTLYGSRVLAFITENVKELDTEHDLDYMRYTVERGGSPLIEYFERIGDG